MNLKINRQEFQSCLSAVNGVVAPRTPKPILQCVLLDIQPDFLLLSCTDQEIGMRCACSQVDVTATGQAVVSADTLLSIVRESVDETLELELDSHRLHVRGAGSHFQIACSSVEDFPPVPAMEGDPDFTLPIDELVRMIEWTQFACAKESTRFAINGILFDLKNSDLVLASTDGRRLSRASGAIERTGDDEVASRAIVPTKALSLLHRAVHQPDDVASIKILPNQMLIRAAHATISTALVEGNFPKYEDVIPTDNDKRADLETAEFLSALCGAALLTNEESKGVRLMFEEGTLTLASRAPEQGEATIKIPIQFTGEAIEIGFNPAFFIEALRAVRGERVAVTMRAPDRPGIIETEDGMVHVVMPVSLS